MLKMATVEASCAVDIVAVFVPVVKKVDVDPRVLRRRQKGSVLLVRVDSELSCFAEMKDDDYHHHHYLERVV